MSVNFRSVVHALSDALDLVGVNDVHHGKRVGIMAAAMTAAMGWPTAEREDVFDACLLHDVGVSSSDLHNQLVEEFDGEGASNHAEAGAYLLSGFRPLAHLAPPIRLHHTHWSELRPGYGRTEQVANLIFLCDRIDVLVAVAMQENRLPERVAAIRDQVAGHAGTMFDPQLIEVFRQISRRDAFWLDLEPDAVRDYMESIARGAEQSPADLATLRGVASLFSFVVDAKSQFTVEHSEGVARVVRFMGDRCGLDAECCGKLEIAGYLHDLGKLRVPDAILDKPGALAEHERRQIASHAYETYRILSRIPGFEDIAHWASYHHEVPTGEGYPFRLSGADLPFEARLLRAADIFQAMAQDRPYRAALSAEAVLQHMRQLADAGQLDPPILELITAHWREIYRLARPRAESG